MTAGSDVCASTFRGACLMPVVCRVRRSLFVHRNLIILLSVGVVFLGGCRTPQTVKDAWKGTRSYYNQYLNSPATLDFDDTGDSTDYQKALGEAISEFDLQLVDLERVLQNSDQRPDAAWVSATTGRFPWLSGLALTDEYGTPRALIPPDFPKPFDAAPLTEPDPKQLLKDLRAYVQETPLGPEIYVGNPVYAGEDFRGLIAVHFDPRTLLIRSGDPNRVVIASPKGILWPGLYTIEETPLAGVNWDELVKENASGTLSNAKGSFYWISRYLGNLPLIYAIRIKGEFARQPENLAGLDEASKYAIGQVAFDNAPGEMPPVESSGEAPRTAGPDPRNQNGPQGQ
jgi:hypothetical protein